VLWETAGETTPPSINDQIASGIGGAFLGEPLFRMASLLSERGGQVPRFWRELGAAAISPPTGFNRLVFGDRFDAVLPSRHPTFNWRLQLGGSWTAHNGLGASQSVSRSEAIAGFALAYGLPGKPDYSYTRPFDYFNFEFTASSANILENIMARGLLVGTRYGTGEAYRGAWGLYGSYDYIARPRSSASRASLSRSVPLPSGGFRKRWRSKARPSPASATGRGGPFMASVSATTTTALPRKDSSRSASFSVTQRALM
jgi:hypothetical protein